MAPGDTTDLFTSGNKTPYPIYFTKPLTVSLNSGTVAIGTVKIASGFSALLPSTYDYFAFTYTGNNITGATFKTSGAAGTTVATLTMVYSGNFLISGART